MTTETTERMRQAFERLCADEQPFVLEASKRDIFQLIAALQLACRHPEFNGSVRQTVEAIARQMGSVLTVNDPDLRLLINLGWEPDLGWEHTTTA